MCKPIDEPQCTTTITSSSSTPLNEPPLERRKRVRFGPGQIVEFETATVEDAPSIWYSRQDFVDMRLEIGQVVQARALGDVRCNDESFYCVRGLEFLKLDDHIPSRKERRLCFAKNVLIFQCMANNIDRSKDSESDCESKTNDNNISYNEQALSAYCAKLSQDAKLRALTMASFDETEAREVYYECRLIYELNGKEMRMFAPTCSLQASMCGRSNSKEEGYHSSLPLLPQVFSFGTWARAKALFTASVNCSQPQQ